MNQRDPKLSTNWQKVYRESGMVYINNRSTLEDHQPEDSEEASRDLIKKVEEEIEVADRDLYEEK